MEEVSQIACFVPSGIVQNKVYFPLSRLEKITDKVAKGLGIESGASLVSRHPVFKLSAPKKPFL